MVSPWLIRRRAPSVVSVFLCVVVWIPLVFVATLQQNPVVGLAMWGLCSVVGVYINVALRAHQAETFPNGQFGRIIGITRFLSVGAVALGAFSGGWIIRLLGIHGTGLLVGVMFAAIPMMLMVFYFSDLRGFLVDVSGRMRKVTEAECQRMAGAARRVMAGPSKDTDPALLGEAETPRKAPVSCSAPAGRR